MVIFAKGEVVKKKVPRRSLGKEVGSRELGC